MKLTPEDEEKLYEIYSDAGIRNLETIVVVKEGRIAQSDAKHADWEGPLRSLLGDEGYARFAEHVANFPGKTLVSQLQGQLGENVLNEDQRSRLLAVLRAEPFEVTTALAGDYDIQSLSSQEELEKRYRRQADSTQNILKGAAAFLTPEQLEALGTMHTNIMNYQKAHGTRIGKKF